METTTTQELVRSYFRGKTRQLRATAELPICEHSLLKGSHREELHRIYLREILPARYSVGRGMIYSSLGMRSRESDVVIWDSANFPSLPMLDHAFFFAESVRMVVECKSRWSQEEFADACDKSKSIRDIFTLKEPSLRDNLNMLSQEVHALREGIEYHGQIIVPYSIATAAIFLSGGASVCGDSITPTQLDSVEIDWPDLTLLLEPGIVLIKNHDEIIDGRFAMLDIFEEAEDALFLFTSAFFNLLNDRCLHPEEPFRLAKYGFNPDEEKRPTARLLFPLHGHMERGNFPIWE